MNLQNIAAGVVSSVNPMQTASIAVSAGYTTAADGSRIPTYHPPVRIPVQVQELSQADLAAATGMNLQGQAKVMYMNGSWQGVVRADGKGGDVITLQDGTIWLVVRVLEDWQDERGWVKVLTSRQLD